MQNTRLFQAQDVMRPGALHFAPGGDAATDATAVVARHIDATGSVTALRDLLADRVWYATAEARLFWADAPHTAPYTEQAAATAAELLAEDARDWTELHLIRDGGSALTRELVANALADVDWSAIVAGVLPAAMLEDAYRAACAGCERMMDARTAPLDVHGDPTCAVCAAEGDR